MASTQGPDLISMHHLHRKLSKLGEAAIELESELEAIDAGKGQVSGAAFAMTDYESDTAALISDLHRSLDRYRKLVKKAGGGGDDNPQVTRMPARLPMRRSKR